MATISPTIREMSFLAQVNQSTSIQDLERKLAEYSERMSAIKKASGNSSPEPLELHSLISMNPYVKTSALASAQSQLADAEKKLQELQTTLDEIKTTYATCLHHKGNKPNSMLSSIEGEEELNALQSDIEKQSQLVKEYEKKVDFFKTTQEPIISTSAKITNVAKKHFILNVIKLFFINLGKKIVFWYHPNDTKKTNIKKEPPRPANSIKDKKSQSASEGVLARFNRLAGKFKGISFTHQS
jgi:hypothetical protein